jgi:hypothetical protein
MIKIKNWDKFQHFKDRRPPWVKLYRDILDDKNWFDLSGDDAKLLVMFWLIASENGGELTSVEDLSFRLRKSEKEIKSALTRLKTWLIQDDIEMISEGYRDDALETERETEKERETKANVELVFNHYKTVIKKTDLYKLSSERKKLIEKSIKRHDVDSCLKAINGMATDDWDKRANYNGIEYAIGIIKGVDNVEKWASYTPTATSKPLTYQDKHAEAQRKAALPISERNYDPDMTGE